MATQSPKGDYLAIFRSHKDFGSYDIIDYIEIDNKKIPLFKAAILFYDKKNNNSCNIAFIYGDACQEICFAVNEVEGVKTFNIAEGSHLSYVGGGAVTTSIRKIDTNEVLNYKLIYSYEESTNSSYIEVNSEKS